MLCTHKSLHTAPENNYSPSRPFVCLCFVVDINRGGIYHRQTGGGKQRVPSALYFCIFSHEQPDCWLIYDSLWVFVILLRSNKPLPVHPLPTSFREDSALKHFCKKRSSVPHHTLELLSFISIKHVSGPSAEGHQVWTDDFSYIYASFYGSKLSSRPLKSFPLKIVKLFPGLTFMTAATETW